MAPAERELIATAAALGAESVPGLSPAETALLAAALPSDPAEVARVRAAIQAGEDPLGDAFTTIRSAKDRRPLGATYTPKAIVHEMARWAAEHAGAVRVVDPGVGSARFLRAAAGLFPNAQLIGCDIDPLATLIARGSLAAAGLSRRARIVLQDYRRLALDPVEGRTLFIGNPPYVRHHEIDAAWKRWLTKNAATHGFTASQLAGLHVHFLLHTAGLVRDGDFGALITSAEWLDVNYGQLARDLFLGPLGGLSLVIVDPKAEPFPDAQSTAVIATFEAAAAPAQVQVRRAETAADIPPVGQGVGILRARLEEERRWSHLLHVAPPANDGLVELGELCRVHRGAVTGKNAVWIHDKHGQPLPDCVLFPSVTKAKELISAGSVLVSSTTLKRVIDIPSDLDQLEREDKRVVEKFLRWARTKGAHESYIAQARSPWWAVGLREPPPIFSTYMARRPPAFVRNRAAATYINIAHGIYPRQRMTHRALDRLRDHLTAVAAGASGRTYAGGLQKFEPREVERIKVPALAVLEARE